MIRETVLRSFVSHAIVLDRYCLVIEDRRVDRRSQPKAFHDEHNAFARAEAAGDVTLADDDDGDTIATLTPQGRERLDRILRTKGTR